MPEFLRLTVDKFTFRVAQDRFYTAEGVWVLRDQSQGTLRVLIGVTDYLQQHNGDVAFANVKSPGTAVKVGDTFAELETMKVNVDLSSPVSGTIVEVNKTLELTPENVNQDPYDKGWLVRIEVTDWEADRAKLLEPASYLSAMQSQAEQELKS
jgi:glycine cleavage system H protein